MGVVYMSGALFALDLILLYHFVSPLPSSLCPYSLVLSTYFMDSSSLICLPSPLLCFSLFFRFASSPSLLLLPLSSPSNLISLRPFLLLLLCPPSLYTLFLLFHVFLP